MSDVTYVLYVGEAPTVAGFDGDQWSRFVIWAARTCDEGLIHFSPDNRQIEKLIKSANLLVHEEAFPDPDARLRGIRFQISLQAESLLQNLPFSAENGVTHMFLFCEGRLLAELEVDDDANFMLLNLTKAEASELSNQMGDLKRSVAICEQYRSTIARHVEPGKHWIALGAIELAETSPRPENLIARMAMPSWRETNVAGSNQRWMPILSLGESGTSLGVSSSNQWLVGDDRSAISVLDVAASVRLLQLLEMAAVETSQLIADTLASNNLTPVGGAELPIEAAIRAAFVGKSAYWAALATGWLAMVTPSNDLVDSLRAVAGASWVPQSVRHQIAAFLKRHGGR